MILTLEINYEKDLDLLSFLPRENAIKAPGDSWFQCIEASLRMKHSVLIVTGEIPSTQIIDQTKRWVVGPDWIWLAPRSLSFISTAYQNKPMSFLELLECLRTSK